MSPGRPSEINDSCGISYQLFFGGNTRYGFHCLFENLTMRHARLVYILKGNPGSGKSTMIKRIGSKLQHSGLTVEYYRCASDYNSLDGLYSPQIGVAVVDGTAPHQIDPQLVGVRDCIVNLSQCRHDQLLKNLDQDQFARLKRQGRSHFTAAYGYLKVAGICEDTIWSLMQLAGAIDRNRLRKLSARLLDCILQLPEKGQPPEYLPSKRRAFLSAITPQGVKSDVRAITNGTKKCWVLGGASAAVSHALLSRVSRGAQEHELSHWDFASPLDPDRLAHCFFPQREAMILSTATAGDSWDIAQDVEVIDIAGFVDLKQSEKLSKQVNQLRGSQKEAMRGAIDQLVDASLVHQQLEGQYICSMNFDCLDETCAELIEDINERVDDI